MLAIASNSSPEDTREADGWDEISEEYLSEEMEPAASSESSAQSLKEIERLIRVRLETSFHLSFSKKSNLVQQSLLDAKGEDDNQEGETKEQEKNGMDIDAPIASANALRPTAPLTTSTEPKPTSSKSTLDIINERRRESERERERQKANAPKPSPSQDSPSDQRPPLPRLNSLSVRGAASLGQATKTVSSLTVDVDLDDAMGSSLSNNHAHRASHGDARPSKRAKPFPSQVDSDISSTSSSHPVGNTMSRTPSLLARLQPSDDLNAVGGGAASTGSLASRLLSPSLPASKSAPQKVSATSLDTQNLSSRGHRPNPGTAASSIGFAIKGQADSVANLPNGPRGYSAAPPTSTGGVTEFRIRGAAQRGDNDSGGRLSLLDRLRDTSIAGEGENKSKKRKR